MFTILSNVLLLNVQVYYCIKHNYIDIPMDATNMQFRDNSFEFAIDKGTYDALAVKFNRKQ